MAAGFKKGDLVTSEKPFAYVLKNECRGIFCDYCFKGNPDLRRCAQCHIVMYCNTDCQREAWSEHKNECMFMEKFFSVPLHGDGEIDMLLLLARTTFKLKVPQVSQKTGDYSRTLQDIKSNPQYTDEYRERFVRLYNALKTCMGEKFRLLQDEAIEIFAKVAYYRREIKGPEKEYSTGIGFYPGASVFEHSCDPDCEVFYNGRELYVRALKDKKDKKTISVSYTDVQKPVNLRQKELESKFFFICTCDRCKDSVRGEFMVNVTDHDKALSVIEKTREVLRRLDQVNPSEGSHFEHLKEIKECLKLQEGVLADSHCYRAELLRRAQDLYTKLELYDVALKYSLKNLEVQKKADGFVSRNLVNSYYKTAKLYMTNGHVAESAEAYKKAYEAARKLYGSKHEFTEKLAKLCTSYSVMDNKDEVGKATGSQVERDDKRKKKHK